MNDKFKKCQVFWLDIPLLNFKEKFKEKINPRPFLIYKVDNTEIILLKITSKDKSKDIIPRPQHQLIHKPAEFYEEKSFVDLNILVYIEKKLFPSMLNKAPLKKQGYLVIQKDFDRIIKGVESCFSNEVYLGDRYEVRVK